MAQRIAHQTSNLGVVGSNPTEAVFDFSQPKFSFIIIPNMDFPYFTFKTQKCKQSCSDLLCQNFHSDYDHRRPEMDYASIICLDAIKHGHCAHTKCGKCSNYTEYLYHKNNYKVRKCIAATIGAECTLKGLCPFVHGQNEREGFLKFLAGVEEIEEANKRRALLEANAEAAKRIEVAPVYVPDPVYPADDKQWYVYNHEVHLFEDRYNEFKECKGRNFDISYACNLLCTYVSAFLNTEGGKIYYGISDSGIVSGVKLQRKFRDIFTQSFDNSLNKFRPPVGPDLYSVNFEPVYLNDGRVMYDTYVIEIVVRKGDFKKIYYTHKEEAFIKRDSSVSQLKGPSLVEFSKGRE